MLSKIIIKLLEIFTQPIKRKLRGQNFFTSLYHLSLTGMNIGQGSNLINSGELYVIKYIKEKITNEKKIILFDVGANIGKYSIALKKYFQSKESEIFSFEPVKKSFDDLRLNTKKLNNLKL